MKTINNMQILIGINSLSKEESITMQSILNHAGNSLIKDGIVGPKTIQAWRLFINNWGNNTVLPGQLELTLKAIKEKAARAQYDFSTKEGTIAAIRTECIEQGLGLDAQVAYVLATVEHETAGTFKPVEEAFWLTNADAWRKRNLRYYPYHGRGYVQITWKANYEKFSSILGVDLVNNPDLAMDPTIALKILVYGFKHGTFTGHRLIDFINEYELYLKDARLCINGTDKAEIIAGRVKDWLDYEH